MFNYANEEYMARLEMYDKISVAITLELCQKHMLIGPIPIYMYKFKCILKISVMNARK